MDTFRERYILGLDLGSASLGWAVVGLNDQLEPYKLLAAGAHIYDPGVEVPPTIKIARDEAILQGQDRSKAVGRRIARQMRRQNHRKNARQKALFRLLQETNLLPSYPEFAGEVLEAERHHTFNRLDKELADALCNERRRRGVDGVMLEADQALMYVLRKEALERELTLQELGRALFHLSQRRGYRPSASGDSVEEEAAAPEEQSKAKRVSKKKSAEDDSGEKDKENSKTVEAEIARLSEKMQAAKTPTYGAYFANFANNNPHIERIRHRWTSREMYRKEFDLIWQKQSEFYRESHPDLLTDELKEKIANCLFFQRPLASTEHLIGKCDLEPAEPRAPWASLEAQRFRLLQKVNDLAWFLPRTMQEEPLTPEQRVLLANELQNRGDLTFEKVCELLNLPPKTEFNLERGKKKKIEGNRIVPIMQRVFRDRWNDFSTAEQENAVELWRTPEGMEERIKKAIEQLNLDQFFAQIWAEKRPPREYCRHSRKALARLLELMETGVPYATARKALYGNPFAGKEPLPLIPQIKDAVPSITNPAVMRALNELRKVVNAIIRKYGKPYQIRIELARELRKNRKQRHDTTEANEKNHERRVQAAIRILKECQKYGYDAQGRDAEGLVRERRDDVTKMLLHMECGGICPYKGGDPISYGQLFGGEVEVEHIIPQSLMVDNSFGNLTLTFRKTNLEKLGRTPWEAFGGDGKDDQWAQIIDRVKKFNNREKLGRFQQRTPAEALAFADRRLNDTRYTSKLAGRLLMSLYGGRDVAPAETQDEMEEFKDRTGRRAIFVSSGMVTALLRDAWCLNLSDVVGEEAYKCLEAEVKDGDARQKRRNEPKKKDRCDHRHHALDAVVIALTSEGMIRRINTQAANYYSRQKLAAQPQPLTYRELMKLVRREDWPECLNEDLRTIFQKMVASRKPEHKLSGALHDATFYGKERPSKDGSMKRHQRIAISNALTDVQIENICDEGIKRAVKELGDAIGGYKKWSVEKHDWPKIPNLSTGEFVPIRKVRINITKNSRPLDTGKRWKAFGQGRPERNVEEGEIAYASFFNVQDRRGTKWVSEIVKLFEATQRVRALPKAERGKQRISERHSKFPDAVFRFSLMKGDLVELLHEGKVGVFVIRSFEADNRIKVAPINAASRDDDLKKAGHLLRLGFTEFLSMGAGEDKVPRPVTIDLLGQAHYIKLRA
jgi:CRISPR-associated endonuclease Csn1